jgi:integrase
MGFTANRSFKIEKGLYLEERKNAANYRAVASVKGRRHAMNTETADFERAQRLAVSWFKRLLTDDANPSSQVHTMGEAAKKFLADIQKPVTKAFYELQWSVISPYFKTMDLDAVTTPVLKEFLRWRQRTGTRGPVKPHTLHKNLVCVRRILRWSAEEGWLDRLPVFPELDTIVANPRPWLDPDEWQTLQRVAKERITKEDNPRTKRQRQELYDFMLMMVHSCARVDEVRNLRVRDCAVKRLTPKGRPYLEMRISGKTGMRKSIAWSGAVSAFERLVERGHLKPEDLLFQEHHRDGFRELLEVAELRKDMDGNVRNLKSLRSTGLMMRIKSNPSINLKLLAQNVGTSVSMLDNFYLKKLTVDLHVEELV